MAAAARFMPSKKLFTIALPALDKQWFMGYIIGMISKEATYTLWHNGNLVDRVPHDPESLDELMEWAYDADGTVEIYSTKGDDDLVWSNYGDEPNEPSDAWHDADALASAGMGTDEDYGYYGE